MQRGGTDTTDSQLGTKAWPHVHAALHLDDPATR